MATTAAVEKAAVGADHRVAATNGFYGLSHGADAQGFNDTVPGNEFVERAAVNLQQFDELVVLPFNGRDLQYFPTHRIGLNDEFTQVALPIDAADHGVDLELRADVLDPFDALQVGGFVEITAGAGGAADLLVAVVHGVNAQTDPIQLAGHRFQVTRSERKAVGNDRRDQAQLLGIGNQIGKRRMERGFAANKGDFASQQAFGKRFAGDFTDDGLGIRFAELGHFRG